MANPIEQIGHARTDRAPSPIVLVMNGPKVLLAVPNCAILRVYGVVPLPDAGSRPMDLREMPI
jgi:hypothetical protein